jgi:hypothetical protein
MLRFPSTSQGSREPSLFQLRGIVRAEQGTAADAFQRPLRFRLQSRLSASVRCSGVGRSEEKASSPLRWYTEPCVGSERIHL